MMSKEEVAEIMTYCKEKGISYKSRLAELDIPALKFYDSKSRYAKEQADSKESAGEFLQLTSGGEFVPMPSFAATTGRGFSKKKDQPQKMMSIELSVAFPIGRLQKGEVHNYGNIFCRLFGESSPKRYL